MLGGCDLAQDGLEEQHAHATRQPLAQHAKAQLLGACGQEADDPHICSSPTEASIKEGLGMGFLPGDKAVLCGPEIAFANPHATADRGIHPCTSQAAVQMRS